MFWLTTKEGQSQTDISGKTHDGNNCGVSNHMENNVCQGISCQPNLVNQYNLRSIVCAKDNNMNNYRDKTNKRMLPENQGTTTMTEFWVYVVLTYRLTGNATKYDEELQFWKQVKIHITQ